MQKRNQLQIEMTYVNVVNVIDLNDFMISITIVTLQVFFHVMFYVSG